MIIGKERSFSLVLNFEESEEQAGHSGVEKVILPDGHMSHIENQEEVLSALTDFIKNVVSIIISQENQPFFFLRKR